MKFDAGLRRVVTRVLAVAALVLQMPAFAHDVTPFEGVTAFTIDTKSGGFTRHTLYLRPTTAATTPPPAVVMLHYLRGRGDDMADLIEASRIVRDFGAWVLLPDAIAGNWNYGSGSLIGGVSALANDVSFLSDLIKTSITNYGLDPHRIYMAGYSNGGLMTMRFACDHPEQIAAAGNVARVTMRSSDAKACKPTLPTPFLMMNGDADPVSTYDGTKSFGVTLTMSAPATAAFWAQIDGCAKTPVGSELPDTIADGTTIHLDTYSGCTALGEVDFYTVRNGGHTWPGAIGFSPELGLTSQDVDATSLLMKYLLRYSRP